MKKLVKIKLINWHLYNNTEIDINNNTCICGENGSGKSTLIDALHFVLSGGTCKFNTAANERNDRNVESYVRGKLGYENKEYLRTNDVISHIALEFFDEDRNEYSVIGSIIYASKGSKLEKHFYNIQKSTIESKCYLTENQSPVLLMELYNNYFKLGKEVEEFKGTVEQVKLSILNFLGLERKDAEKYLELLPKALAFKPIANINNFVFDYLLPEKSLSLDNMKDNVRNYNYLESIITKENEKLESLDPIVDLSNRYLISRNTKTYLDTLLNENKLDEFNKIRKENISLMNSNSLKIEELEKNKDELNEKKDNLIKEITNLENNELNNELKQLNERNSKYAKELENSLSYKDKISGDIELLHNILSIDDIKINNSLKNYFYKEKYIEYKKEVSIVKEKLEDKNDYLIEEKKNYSDDFNKYKKVYDEKQEIKDNLEKGKKTYGENIINLIDVLKEHFKNEFNIDVEISVFSDLVDNIDATWRNALEGYLNTRRFYLFIDKKYYDEALRVYEAIAKENKINVVNVGLVNTNKLLDINIDDINENSLFSKMEYLTDDAKRYAFMVLNNVICVDSVDDLKNYDTSITATGMLYSGCVARFINPKIYAIPFLGRKSIEIQILKLNDEIDKLYNIINELLNSVDSINKAIENIKKGKEIANRIDFNENIFDSINGLKSKLSEIEEEIEKLNDSNLISIQETIDEKKKDKESTILKIKVVEENIMKLRVKNSRFDEEINSLNIKIKDLETVLNNSSNLKEYNNFKMRYKNKSNKDIELELNDVSKDVYLKERDLIALMSTYIANESNNCDFKADVININKFINLYNEIKDRNLIKYKDQAKKAKEECEKAFKNDFLNKIRFSINETFDNIKELNKILSRDENRFGKEKEVYEFVITGSKNLDMKQYYDIFVSNEDFNNESLFSEVMSEKHAQLMETLFKKITSENEKETEKELAKYIDYRNYMDYDIKITDRFNNVSYYSKGGKGKSGGETQTPFYVFIAASFNSICGKNKYSKRSPICLMFLDEAFNNMDESRIETMMNFYSKLNIQVIISVPTQRVSSIYKSVETVLGIAKQNDNAIIFKLEKNGISQ